MSRLSFPHDIVISFFCVSAFILNVVNVVCSAVGHKVNAVEVIQISKSVLSLAALVICVPMAAAGFDGGADSVIVFDAVTDIIDTQLIHTLPIAFLVMAVVRFKISTCTFIARDIIKRKWLLIVLILSIVPAATMAVLRVPIAVHDVNMVRDQRHDNSTFESLQSVNDRKWFVIFKTVRMCGLNIIPTIAGIAIYAMIHRHLAAQDIRNRATGSRFTSQASGSSTTNSTLSIQQIATDRSPSILTNSRSSRQLSVATPVSGSALERIRSPSEKIRVAVVILLITHLASWTAYLMFDSLLLFDVNLPEGCVLYGKVFILLCSPIGDGVFQKSKRDRLGATIRKVVNRNTVSAADDSFPLPQNYFAQQRKEFVPYCPDLPDLVEIKGEDSYTTDSPSLLPANNSVSPKQDKVMFNFQQQGQNDDTRRFPPSTTFIPTTEETENKDAHATDILPCIEPMVDITSRSFTVEPIFNHRAAVNKAPGGRINRNYKLIGDTQMKSAITTNDVDVDKLPKYAVSKGALVEMYLKGESNLSHHLHTADLESPPPILLISSASNCSTLKRRNTVGSLKSVCSDTRRKSITSMTTYNKRGSCTSTSGLSSDNTLRLASVTSAEISFLQRQLSSTSTATQTDLHSRPPSRCDNVSENNRKVSRDDSVFTTEDVNDRTTCAVSAISEYF